MVIGAVGEGRIRGGPELQENQPERSFVALAHDRDPGPDQRGGGAPRAFLVDLRLRGPA